MKKKVNGRVVDIKNMDIFEKAFEGMALNRVATSEISDKLESKVKMVNKSAMNRVIVAYTKMYEALPFPLYGIEEPIKYCVLGNCIRSILDDIKCWVNDGLYVSVGDGTVIRFIGNSWCSIDISNDKNIDTNIDIEEYEGCVGYEEFSWVMETLQRQKSTSLFYQEFMPEFVKACLGQPMILQWELSKILDFGSTPDKMELKENKLIDVYNNKEYSIDIFSNGKSMDCGEDTFELIIDSKGKSEFKSKPKLIKVYDFDAYIKEVKEDKHGEKDIKKLKIDNVGGLSSVFEVILHEGINSGKVENIKYTGVIVDGIIIYKVNNGVYICNLNRYEKSQSITTDVDIYGIDGSRVYLEKVVKCGSGVKKSTIYAFDVHNKKNIRLCKIQYIKAE